MQQIMLLLKEKKRRKNDRNDDVDMSQQKIRKLSLKKYFSKKIYSS